MRGEKINKICVSCGFKFEDYISNRRSSFCSLQCYWKSKKGSDGYWKGKKRSIETIKKISLSKTGIQSPLRGIKRKPHSEATKLKLSVSNIGKHPKTKNFIKGEKHFNWKGGVTPVNKIIRRSIEYKSWRKTVFERDDYTCVLCGAKKVYLEADHIKPFAYFPELRFEASNGRTLCTPCHSQTDTYKARAKNYVRN